MRIVGVSFDRPEANKNWREKKGFSFELWTDDDQRTLAQHFGAADSSKAGRAGRVTVLLDAQGRVLLQYNVGFDLGTHPSDVLEDATRLFVLDP